MEKVKIYYSKETDSMDIWFDDPEEEVISEEAGEGVILKKNKYNKVIGIEKLYVSKLLEQKDGFPVELIT